ncbi:hypothetical protein HOE425_320389 [Hoeflea sp. EC-HK425]|nr:hypothetical protein HOE425_320389 [Hoeflea sp. EC-HK425]
MSWYNFLSGSSWIKDRDGAGHGWQGTTTGHIGRFVNPRAGHGLALCCPIRLYGPLSGGRGTYLTGMETILVDQG